MKKILLSVILIGATGCSTLHVHKGFYLDKEKTAANAMSACEAGAGDYGEPVLLKIDDKEFKVLPWPKQGFVFLGPILVPLIPVFWISRDVDSIGIKVLPTEKSSSEVNLHVNQWYLILDDGTKIIPHVKSHETLDSGVAINNIGGGVWLVFNFSKRAVPETFTLVAPQSFKRPNESEEQKIVFVKSNRWHYVPLIFMHTEWPYAHTLPCEGQ